MPAVTLWGGVRVPVTLLGGYLGAGKTTLVNQALTTSGGRRIAVLVNDVGSVAVDATLIAARHGDTIELTNGCVCCSLVDGFAVALEALRQRPEPPDHVLVELSGVAEPDRVRPWTQTAGFRPDGVVVAVAADQIAARLADARIGAVVAGQIGTADLVVLTRIDLVEDPTAARALVEMHTSAPLVVSGVVRPSADVLLGPAPVAPRVGVSGEPSAPHHVGIAAVPVLPTDLLARRLADLPDDVVRVKGIVTTDEGDVLVQRVGATCRIDAAAAAPSGLVVLGLREEAVAAAVAALEASAGEEGLQV